MSDRKASVVDMIKEACTAAVIGPQDYDKSLKDLGVDSLDFSSIILEIEEKNGIKISDEDAEKLSSVNIIADYIDQKVKANTP